NVLGRTYLATLDFTTGNVIQVFRSNNDGASFLPPVNGAPGRAGVDKEWITVDNFAGPGQGNVYLVFRDFAGGNGIYFTRSLDNGTTYVPAGGTLIASGAAGNVQGAFVAVGPDHSVDVFWFDNTLPGNVQRIMMRRSTD